LTASLDIRDRDDDRKSTVHAMIEQRIQAIDQSNY
jgi:hypothetical protein